jgi:TrbL/VirB6 plasmid conjugal transfer protein
MLTARRVPRMVAVALLLLAVLVGLGGGKATHSHGTAASSRRTATARTLAVVRPDGHSPCSVPGIGDIGGLLGFCSIGSSGLVGSLNSLCNPGTPEPESASSGVDGLISPPASTGPRLATAYNEYGMSGQFWAATNLQCSDMTSLIGNDVAGMIFDFAKALDRVTITVYQSAAGEGILGWLQNVTDRLVSGLGKAIYFPYVAVVVILGAIWLAWQGLIRKRGTRTIEGTLWMVVACAAAIWLIGRPADFTGLGKGVSDGISTTLDAAFAHLPSPGQASCVPVASKDPQISESSFAYTSGSTVVDQNANDLWTVLVCKPWLEGEFGMTAATQNGKPTVVSAYARQLLWAQAIAVNEHPTTGLISAKQAAYAGIAQTMQQQDPSVYPLFQGKEWTTRLEIAFAALLAAVVAGLLILLVSVTLILLKLGFLLLLIAGPFFLLVGTHPGFGRVVAIRWFEMLVGVLLKQAAVALALSILLYCYALIMGTSDAVLSWSLKILMITLVTVAVFIYRKPFQHLFTAVGYGAIGSTDRAGADLSRAAATARTNTMTAALAIPGFAAYRAARWARRNPAQAAGLALGSGAAAGTAGAGAADAGATSGMEPGSGSLDQAGGGAPAGASARARAWATSAGTAPASQAPPLRLPPAQGAPSSWASSGSAGNGSAGNGSAGGPWAGPTSGSRNGSPPPARSQPGASRASSSRGPSGPPAWSGRSAPASSRRPAGASWRGGNVRDDSQARREEAPKPGASQAGRSSPDSAQPGGSAADRAPRPSRPARPPAPGGPSGQGKSGRAGRPAKTGAGPSRAEPGSGASPGQGSSMTPFGMRPGAGDEQSGPFWTRPIRRRK